MLPNHSRTAARRGSGHRGPADQRAPREDQPEPRLRPPGDALHERVSGDRREAGERDDRRSQLSWSRTTRPIAQERRSGSTPSATTRARWRAAAAGCARPCGRGRGRRCRCRRSPRCASRRRRAQPQEQVPAAVHARQRHAPRARPVEQPGADRPIEPHQRCEGAQPRRQGADEPAPLAVGYDVGRCGHAAALARHAPVPMNLGRCPH